jgi:hypothetical protein
MRDSKNSRDPRKKIPVAYEKVLLKTGKRGT